MWDASQDVLERITVCVRVLLDPSSLALVKDTFLTKCKESYAAFLKFKHDEVRRPARLPGGQGHC